MESVVRDISVKINETKKAFQTCPKDRRVLTSLLIRINNNIKTVNKVLEEIKLSKSVGEKRALETCLSKLLTLKTKIKTQCDSIDFGESGSSTSTGGILRGTDAPVASNNLDASLRRTDASTVNKDLGVKWENMKSAFKKRLQTNLIVNVLHKDPNSFMRAAEILLEAKAKDFLRKYCAFKTNVVLCCQFLLPSTDERDFKYFNSENQTVTRTTDLKKLFRELSSGILIQLEDFCEYGSGWILVSTESLTVSFNQYQPLGGASFVKLPAELARKRNAVLNIRNSDRLCFIYCILAHMYPADVESDKPESYPRNYHEIFDLRNIQFPLKICDITKFEKQNSFVAINAYSYDRKSKSVCGPLHLSKNVDTAPVKNQVNLLYLTNGRGPHGHFCLIKDMSSLCRSQFSKHENKHFICYRCLNHFQTKEKHDKHLRNCSAHDAVKIEFPEDETHVRFKNYKSMLKTPFVIYCDMESLTKEIETCSPNPDTSYVHKYQKHIPFSAAYLIVCSFDQSLNFFDSYRGPEPEKWLVEKLENEARKIEIILQTKNEPLKLEQAEVFGESDQLKNCPECNISFDNKNNRKVRHHDHHTGEFLGYLCNNCNLLIRVPKYIPVIFHNGSNYDMNFLFSALIKHKSPNASKYINETITIIPCTMEKYIAVIKRVGTVSLRFIDSFRFLNSSLDKLAQILTVDDKKIVRQFFPEDEQFSLVCKKGIFPYDHVNCWKTLDETVLPPKERFFSKLRDEPITDEDYAHARKVWDFFNCKTLGEYSDLYLKIDVLLLADIFEKFRELTITKYGVDSSSFLSGPGLAFDAALKFTKTKLPLLKSVDMILFIESAVRGGITQSVQKYVKANNKFCASFDPDKPISYITYLDANNLYGWAMSQKLPFDDFRWLSDVELSELENNLIANRTCPAKYCFGDDDDEISLSCFLEVDIEYPDFLHDRHNDLPFCPERACTRNSGKNKKLLTTLHDKNNYVIHLKLLLQCLENGLRLKKIHRVLEFSEKAWLKPYIMFNTEMRARAEDGFMKDFFKSMNNQIYGKTIENIRKRRIVKVATNWKSARKLIAEPNFKHLKIIDENTIIVELNKTSIVYDKPIYVGIAILELSKLLMYSFHYDYVQQRLRNDFDVHLLYMDTDSFIYKFSPFDPSISIYDVIRRDAIEFFDTSDYEPNNAYDISRVNKKVIGKFKDEMNGKIITHFASVRPKVYAYKLNNSNKNVIKMKGIGAAGKKKITFADFEKVLFSAIRKNNANDSAEERNISKKMRSSFNAIRTFDQQVYSVCVNKISLDFTADDKRYVCVDEDGKITGETYAWGHYTLRDQ